MPSPMGTAGHSKRPDELYFRNFWGLLNTIREVIPRFKHTNLPKGVYVRCPSKYGPLRSRREITFQSVTLAVVTPVMTGDDMCTYSIPVIKRNWYNALLENVHFGGKHLKPLIDVEIQTGHPGFEAAGWLLTGNVLCLIKASPFYLSTTHLDTLTCPISSTTQSHRCSDDELIITVYKTD